jgi:hypothetical protein
VIEWLEARVRDLSYCAGFAIGLLLAIAHLLITAVLFQIAVAAMVFQHIFRLLFAPPGER